MEQYFIGSDGLLQLAPVTAALINEIWSIDLNEDPPANIGMEVVTSILCGKGDLEVDKMFADKGHGSFVKLDAILSLQETSKMYIARYRLDSTAYPYLPKQQQVTTEKHNVTLR